LLLCSCARSGAAGGGRRLGEVAFACADLACGSAGRRLGSIRRRRLRAFASASSDLGGPAAFLWPICDAVRGLQPR